MNYWQGLEVRMLGDFTLTFEGSSVNLPMKQSAKPMQLLALLLDAGEAGISRQRLIDALFIHESDTDAANGLNVAVSRLRKLLRDNIAPNERYVAVRFNRYYFEVEFPVLIDTNEVESLRQAADLAEGNERISILYQLCDHFYGRFLPDLDGENWVEIQRAYYQRILKVSLAELCMNCQNQHAWNELERLIDFGANLFPYESWEAQRLKTMHLQDVQSVQSASMLDVAELTHRAASGPIFITNEQGAEFVILDRKDYERLIESN